MSLKQDEWFLSVKTPMGPDALAVTEIKGMEFISNLFRFELELVAAKEKVSFKDFIGESITATVRIDEDKFRYINGIVMLFEQGNRPEDAKGGANINYYRAVIVPWLWLLTQSTNSRIFQEKNVKDIVEQIFSDRGNFNYEWKLSSDDKYKKRVYCVQYQETDFDFISRLLEEEGIYYFFKHEDGKHTMILSDIPEENPDCPHHETVQFHHSSSRMLPADYITELKKTIRISTTKYTVNDFNFESPKAPLLVETETNNQDNMGKGVRETYDYPGKYKEHGEGEQLGKLRMEAAEVGITKIRGISQCRGFCPGFRFKLDKYVVDEMNDKHYLLTAVEHKAQQGYEPAGIDQPSEYSNTFHCIPHDIPYRPPRKTPRPKIQGIQTAIVVGPSGEEIYPDKYGRVKVQFHWDREGKNDDKSSCWIRVSQNWAGAGWGGMFIPHIGHEVIVDFVDGDPDRPIITGRVYHGNNMPADTLPDEKTKSVIRSWGDNDIVIEDKDGEKHIQIKQANGNEIILHEKTPSIDINQACGNFIHMRDGEGIHIQDHFGNEVKLDSAAGTLKVRSPSHESEIELGKSIWMGTMSDLRKNVQGNAFTVVQGSKDEYVVGPVKFKWDGTNALIHGGLVSDTFLGAKHESLVGAKVTLNAAKEVNKNALSRDRKAAGHIYYGSSTYIHLEGPGSELKLDDSAAELKSGASYVIVENGDSVMIKAASDIELVAGGDIHLKGGNIILNGNVVGKMTVENPSIKATK